MTAVQSSIDAVRVAAVAADRMKAADIEAFDVSNLLAITDIMMVATAMNERQVIGVAEEVVFKQKDFSQGYDTEQLPSEDQ